MKFEKTLKSLFGKEPDAAVQELLKNIEADYGEVPFILTAMSDKPNVLLPKIIYDDAVLRNPEQLDEKTVELITIGVATALKCDHCLRMHLRVARRKGITQDEIFEAILLASALSNTAALAQAMRVYEEDRRDGVDSRRDSRPRRGRQARRLGGAGRQGPDRARSHAGGNASQAGEDERVQRGGRRDGVGAGRRGGTGRQFGADVDVAIW